MTSPLWDRCLQQLEAELTEQQLNTWIRPLQAAESDSRLRIMAPNRFVLNMVQSNFQSRIQEIASACARPDPVHVELTIGTGITAPAPLVSQGHTDTRQLHDAAAAARHGAPARPLHAAGDTAVLERHVPGTEDPRKARHVSNLNPMFSFDSLVEGKSNQLGRAAAWQIGQNPGTAYNPFLIYGGSGLGKTHLMQAIGHEIVANNPAARVMYLNSERYVAEMVSALQHSRINQFKQFYRSLDALLIDDIQFFAGKEQSQEEFFHNFNALFEGGQQIVLTCDRYPKEVNGLAERLKTRFGWGLTVAVEPPELEMRVAILNSKAEQTGIVLPSEVSFFIAQTVQSNVRELEGALRRVLANVQFTGQPLSLDVAKQALSDLVAVQAKQVTVENIQKTTAEYFKIRLSELSGKSRSRSIARPRQIAMSLAKELTSMSLPEIGQAFGGRDHTTVLHACRKIAELRDSDASVREDYANLQRTLIA